MINLFMFYKLLPHTFKDNIQFKIVHSQKLINKKQCDQIKEMYFNSG